MDNINLGLLLLTCPEAEQLREGDQVTIDLEQRQVRTADGRSLACEPIPGFLVEMVEAGGLLNQLRLKLQAQRASGDRP